MASSSLFVLSCPLVPSTARPLVPATARPLVPATTRPLVPATATPLVLSMARPLGCSTRRTTGEVRVLLPVIGRGGGARTATRWWAFAGAALAARNCCSGSLQMGQVLTLRKHSRQTLGGWVHPASEVFSSILVS